MSIKENHYFKVVLKHFPSIALVGGFIFDILTIRRVDAIWENVWIMIHLLLVASAILMLGRREKGVDQTDSRLNFWLLSLLQFSFGGLLSAFLILYFRSASLSTSWPFLLILFAAFVMNERFKGYHERLVFQISFFYLSLLSFLIFFVPVILGSIGSIVFILSGILSLVVINLFFTALTLVAKDKFVDKGKAFGATVIIFALMNVLYFSNIIPPIPLSLKDAGIYNNVSGDGNGNYLLTGEKRRALDYLKFYQEVNVVGKETLFAYTAIFSPARFNTRVVHEWQMYDEERGEWKTMSRVNLPISGGREEGFRTYSAYDVLPGKWRVNALSEKGLVLGRVKFIAQVSLDERVLFTEVR